MNAQHLSIDELADAAEGLLDPGRAAAVESHLASCADCRGQSEALRKITATLGADVSPPMPEAVAHRLEEVVAAESAPIEPVAASARTGSPTPGVCPARHRWTHHRARLQHRVRHAGTAGVHKIRRFGTGHRRDGLRRRYAVGRPLSGPGALRFLSEMLAAATQGVLSRPCERSILFGIGCLPRPFCEGRVTAHTNSRRAQ